jgi:hypothetical protein
MCQYSKNDLEYRGRAKHSYNMHKFTETKEYGVKLTVDITTNIKHLKNSKYPYHMCGRCLKHIFPKYTIKELEDISKMFLSMSLGRLSFQKYLHDALGER